MPRVDVAADDDQLVTQLRIAARDLGDHVVTLHAFHDVDPALQPQSRFETPVDETRQHVEALTGDDEGRGILLGFLDAAVGHAHHTPFARTRYQQRRDPLLLEEPDHLGELLEFFVPLVPFLPVVGRFTRHHCADELPNFLVTQPTCCRRLLRVEGFDGVVEDDRAAELAPVLLEVFLFLDLDQDRHALEHAGGAGSPGHGNGGETQVTGLQ